MKQGALKANDLTVQQIRWFCQVYEQKSFAAAARKLGYSAPTIWEQVKKLENHYGEVLFERLGRNIQPTRAAKILYEALMPTLAALDSSFEQVRDLSGSTRSTLTVVTGMRMMLEELGPCFHRFGQEHEHIQLRLLHGDGKTAHRLIAEDVADLALTLEPGPEYSLELVVCERAYAIDYLAVFPPRHPLAKKSRLQLQDIVRYPLIVVHRATPTRMALDNALHREDLLEQRKIVIETDNSVYTVACVRAGSGVGVMAGQLNSPLTQGLRTRLLSSSLGEANLVFLTKRGRQLTKAIRALMKIIREECG